MKNRKAAAAFAAYMEQAMSQGAEDIGDQLEEELTEKAHELNDADGGAFLEAQSVKEQGVEFLTALIDNHSTQVYISGHQQKEH